MFFLVCIALSLFAIFPLQALSAGLGEAVDNASLSWNTEDENWFPQTSTAYYGGDAAQSGAITHGQSSWIETTVTGPGTLSFYWKVSSEANSDFLSFSIDGVEQIGSISGEIDWNQKTCSISPGEHTLRWTYTKNGWKDSGEDAGWLDKVEFTQLGGTLGDAVDNSALEWNTGGNTNWTPQTLIAYYGEDAAQSGVIDDNQASWVETTVAGPGTLNFYWKVSSEAFDALVFYIDGVEGGAISGNVNWTQKTFLISPGTHILRWAYSKNGSTSEGDDAGWLDKVEFTESESLGEAVDNTSLTWSTGGDALWFPQTSTFFEPDMAQSGAITGGQSSWVETTVTGPGTLSFYWKVSSEANSDFLGFSIDGVEQIGPISGEIDWNQKTYSIAPGGHTLRWTYTKNGWKDSGDDAGWLDKVEFTGDIWPPAGSVSINSGVVYANTAQVILSLSCTDEGGCAQMQFSNNNTNWSALEPYSETREWSLPPGIGTKTVYARFSDNAGNHATFSDSIELDPEAQLTVISPAYYNFGAVEENSSSGFQTFTITNRHGVDIELGGSIIRGPDKGDFFIASNCAPGLLLKDETRTAIVQFFPKDEIVDSMPELYRNALSLFTGIRSRAALEIPVGEGKSPGRAILRGEMTMPIYRRLTRPWRLIMPGGELIP